MIFRTTDHEIPTVYLILSRFAFVVKFDYLFDITFFDEKNSLCNQCIKNYIFNTFTKHLWVMSEFCTAVRNGREDNEALLR